MLVLVKNCINSRYKTKPKDLRPCRSNIPTISESPAKIPCTRPDPTPPQPAPEPVAPASQPVNTPPKPATPETVVNETEVVLEMKEETPPKPQRQIIHILPLPEKVKL